MGTFDTHGGYFAPKDYMKVEAGGSHEENPNGGVQIGVDQQGVPNLLEEGEPVYKDYVYSDNIKASERFLKENNIPEKYAGELYSKIADSFFSEAENRPNDPISRNGLEAMLGRLADAQEGQKAYNEQRKLERELKQLSPDELAALEEMIATGEQMQAEESQNMQEQPAVMPEEQVAQEQMLAPEQMHVEQPMMAEGGPLDGIDPFLRKKYPDNPSVAQFLTYKLQQENVPGMPEYYPYDFKTRVQAQRAINDFKSEVKRREGQKEWENSKAYRWLDNIDNKYLRNTWLHPYYDSPLYDFETGKRKDIEPLFECGGSLARKYEMGGDTGEPLTPEEEDVVRRAVRESYRANNPDKVANIYDKVTGALSWVPGPVGIAAMGANAAGDIVTNDDVTDVVTGAQTPEQAILGFRRSARGIVNQQNRKARRASYSEQVKQNVEAAEAAKAVAKEAVSTTRAAVDEAQRKLIEAVKSGQGDDVVKQLSTTYDDAVKAFRKARGAYAGKVANFPGTKGRVGTAIGLAATVGGLGLGLIDSIQENREKKNNPDVGNNDDNDDVTLTNNRGFDYYHMSPVVNNKKAGGPINKFAFGGPDGDEWDYNISRIMRKPPVIDASIVSAELPGLTDSINPAYVSASHRMPTISSGATTAGTGLLGYNNYLKNQSNSNIGELARRLYGTLGQNSSDYSDWWDYDISRIMTTPPELTPSVITAHVEPDELDPAIIVADATKKPLPGVDSSWWLDKEAERLGIGKVPRQYPQANILDPSIIIADRGAAKSSGVSSLYDRMSSTLNDIVSKTEIPTEAAGATDKNAGADATTVKTNTTDKRGNPYLSTFPRYAGAIGSGILGLYNALQEPDKYTATRYKPFVPTGRINLQNQVYNPVDQNMLMNQALAQGNSTMRGLRNSGLGPSTQAAMIAQDNNITGNLGNTFLQVWDANNQRRNQVIAANNQAEAQRAQFDYTVDAARQRALADAQMRNAYNDLMIQQLNNEAESAKYAAVSNQINNALQALSGIGQENYAMNQANSNTALEGYGAIGGGIAQYLPYFYKYMMDQQKDENVSCKGGKIQRKKK